MTNDQSTSYIHIEDAAELTGYSPKYLRKLVRSGLIEYQKGTPEMIAWTAVQKLAGQQRPFWVALSEDDLKSQAPSQDLLLHGSEQTGIERQPADSFNDRMEVGQCIDWMRKMPSGAVQTVVTSPPYWGIRAYPGEISARWADGSDSGFGEEATVEEYVAHTLEVLRHLKRVLRDDGTIWWNLGDTYQTRAYMRSSSTERLRAIEGARNDTWRHYPNKRYSSGHPYLKDKDLAMVPFQVAIGAQHLGFYVRSIIVWYKNNAGIDSAKDRPSAIHEYILLLAKSRFYKYHSGKVTEESASGQVIKRIKGREEYEIVRQRSLRSVWEFPPSSAGDHAAAFPLELPIRCIQLSTDGGDLVFDPFAGSGTTLVAAKLLNRHYFGCDILEDYVNDARRRLQSSGEQLPIASQGRQARANRRSDGNGEIEVTQSFLADDLAG